MTAVVKRNGRRQTFNPGKLRRSIDVAAREAGLADARREGLVVLVGKQVISSCKGQKAVRASDLRETILAILDLAEPRVARSWRDHDREAKGVA